MARITDDLPGGGVQGANGKVMHISADSEGSVKAPSADFITDADIARDGQDLVLTAPNGDAIVIDGYFSADPAPLIVAPDGTALTPQLVESFAHGMGSVQFAQAGTMADVTPVGAVHEVHGKATVTHPDGTSENIALGTAIYQGDIVETEGDGAVEILFVDESSFAVSSNARLAIDEFVFDPSSQGGESNFSMLRGMFVYTSGLIGREDPDDVNIGTPVGSIGIRGTTIAGNVDTGEITVVEGAIVLHGLNGSEVTLANQFGTAKFVAGGDVVQMQTLNAEDLGAKFTSMNSVAPAFFSTIDQAAGQPADNAGDSADDGGDGDDNGGDDGLTHTEENTAPADQTPSDATGTNDGVDESAPDAASESMLMDEDTSFDGNADTFSGEVDTFAGTTDGGTTQVFSDTTMTMLDAGALLPPPPPPSGTDTTTTTTTSSSSTGPTLVPLGLTISQTAVDDDIDVLTGNVVATVSTTSSFSSVAYTLLAVRQNGTDVTASGRFGISGTGASAQILLLDATDNIAQGDVLEFSVRGTLPDGRVDTQVFTVNVDDLTTVGNIMAADSSSDATLMVDENATGAAIDLTAVITLDEAPASQPVIWTIQSAVDSFGNDISADLTVNFTGTDNIAQLQIVNPLDFEAAGGFMNVSLRAQTTDDAGQTINYTRTFTITINNIDDATPTLNVNNTRTVNEGGSTIITTAFLDVSDVDTTDANLTYTVTGGLANGQLELTTAPGTAITTFTQADVAAGLVRYVHDNSETTTDSFIFDVDDGAGQSITGNTFSITVNAVNDAPTLTAGAPVLTAVAEDDTIPSGDSPLSFTATSISDPESGTISSIAVTGVNNTNGTWQYSLDAGSSWSSVSPVSNTSALLLDGSASTLIRFVPNANYNGTSSFTYKAWDMSSGTVGSKADTTVGTAFSAASDTATVTVTAVNDAASIDLDANNSSGATGSDFDTTFTEDLGGVPVVDADFALTDVDNANLQSATVTLTNNLDGTLEHLFIVGGDGTYSGITVTGSGTDVITLSGDVSLAAYRSVIAMVRYNNLSDLPDTTQRQVDVTVSDGTASSTASAFVTVTSVLDSDSIIGTTGADTLAGDDGDNTFDGDSGDDILIGGTGSDTFIANWSDGNDAIDGGIGGGDVYDASGVTASAMTFDLTLGTIQDGINTDNFIDIERFIGGTQNDTFIIDNDAGLDINGNVGIDILQFTAGVYNSANFISVSGVEEFSLTGSVTLDLDIIGSLFTNDTGDLVVNVGSTDTLNIDFTTFGTGTWNLVSGDLTGAGNAQFVNNSTGNILNINYAVGASITQMGAGGGALYLNMISAADGFTITDNIAQGFGAGAVAVGDSFDGTTQDGYDDLLIIKGGDTGVFTLNGGAGLTDTSAGSLFSFIAAFAGTATDLSISPVGDFNGDGISDFIVGAPYADDAASTVGSGNAFIMDVNGNVLVELAGLNGGDLTGKSVTGIGDVNGDGFADVLIGAPGAGGSSEGSAYILFGDVYGLGAVIDVTTMEQPSFAGGLGTGAFAADAMDIEIYQGSAMGTMGFVVKNTGEINLVNLSDPSAPAIQGGVWNNAYITAISGYTGAPTDPLNGLVDIVVKGDYLYILSGNVNSGTQGQITVLNISDPVNPVFVNSMNITGLQFATAIDVDLASGDLVVTKSSGGSGSLMHFTVDPGTGAITSQDGTTTMISALNGSNEVIINGNYAYVVTAYDPDGAGAALPGTLQVVDITSAASPAVGTQINIADIKNIFFDQAANRLYVISSAGGTGQVSVYNTSTSGSPVLMGQSTNNAFLAGATDIVVEGGIAFVTTPGGVEALDVSIPASISMIGLLPDGGSGNLNDGMALVIDDCGFLHVVSGGATDTLASIDLLPVGMRIDGVASTGLLGAQVASAGDFNHDGFGDFMVSIPNTSGPGSVSLYFGGPVLDSVADLTFSGIAMDANREIPMLYMGDMSGDGIGDITIVDTAGSGLMKMYFGGNAPNTVVDVAIAGDAAHRIISGGAARDFNGDGFDDAVVVMQDTASPEMVDIFVVYGGGPATLNWTSLNSAANAFHMTYTIPLGADPNNFDFNITAAGDLNGDGLYDLMIGLPDVDNSGGAYDPDGSAIIVYGVAAGGTGAVVFDGDVADGSTGVDGYIDATANNQRLVGSDAVDVLSDGAGSATGVVFRAGAGDDIIDLSGNSFADIDAGGGWDAVAFMGNGTIDFTNLTSEEFSRVEEINLGNTAQTLVLTLSNIFDLMHSSDYGTLAITTGANTNMLQIDDMKAGGQAGADEMQIAQMLGADGISDGGGAWTYWAFSFGGYTLEIDKNLLDPGTNNNVNIV